LIDGTSSEADCHVPTVQLNTEIEIAATPELVWNVLTDFDSYPQWNPLITSIWGPLQVGSRLVLAVSQPGGREMRWRPTVTHVERTHELRWLGRFLFRGLFDGEQFFKLRGLEDGRTRLIHGETFSGLLAERFAHRMPSTARGFAVMNQALKRRAERLS
jgi:hypothetical protein